MDESPSSTTKRAPKRPHSPQQEERPTPDVATKVPAAEPESILASDSKRDKLLRLLGGKKRKNETAASKWLERVRSREDELKVSTELESQFNESLTHRLTGQARRHVGFGFDEGLPPDESKKAETVDPASDTSITTSSKDNKPETESHTQVPKGNAGATIPAAPLLPPPLQGTNLGGFTPSRPSFLHGHHHAYGAVPQIGPSAGALIHGFHPPSRPGPYHGYGRPEHENGMVGNLVHHHYRNVNSGGYTYGNQGYRGSYRNIHQAGYPGPAKAGHSDSRPGGGASQSNPPQRDSGSNDKPNPKSKSSFYAQFKKAS